MSRKKKDVRVHVDSSYTYTMEDGRRRRLPARWQGVVPRDVADGLVAASAGRIVPGVAVSGSGGKAADSDSTASSAGGKADDGGSAESGAGEKSDKAADSDSAASGSGGNADDSSSAGSGGGAKTGNAAAG